MMHGQKKHQNIFCHFDYLEILRNSTWRPCVLCVHPFCSYPYKIWWTIQIGYVVK